MHCDHYCTNATRMTRRYCVSWIFWLKQNSTSYRLNKFYAWKLSLYCRYRCKPYDITQQNQFNFLCLYLKIIPRASAFKSLIYFLIYTDILKEIFPWIKRAMICGTPWKYNKKVENNENVNIRLLSPYKVILALQFSNFINGLCKKLT